MGIRFRKSIKVAPGVRVNVGKKSVGVSVGTKGARASINSSGRKTTSVGIPGTGLSYVKSSGGGSKRNRVNRSANNLNDADSEKFQEEGYADFHEKTAKRIKINSILFRIILAIIGIASLVSSLDNPICLVFCAICIIGFVKVGKKAETMKNDEMKTANLYKSIEIELLELENLQNKANESKTIIDLAFVYEKMEPVVRKISEKAASYGSELSFNAEEMMRETFEGKFDQMIESEFKKEIKAINSLKTRSAMDKHIDKFSNILDSNRDKFTENQNEKIDAYIKDLERARDMISPG